MFRSEHIKTVFRKSIDPQHKYHKESIKNLILDKNSYHASGAWYPLAELPKHDASMSVFITPGLSAIIAIPSGNSFATDLVKPSTAHLDAQ
jgi:hypothetical protein